MAPQFVEFSVSESAAWHMLEKHGVTPEEALEAADSTLVYRPGDPPFVIRPDGTRERRYVIPGKTEDGRRLWVVVTYEGEGETRIITARQPVAEHDRALRRRARGD